MIMVGGLGAGVSADGREVDWSGVSGHHRRGVRQRAPFRGGVMADLYRWPRSEALLATGY
jgi:hypothetical protein